MAKETERGQGRADAAFIVGIAIILAAAVGAGIVAHYFAPEPTVVTQTQTLTKDQDYMLVPREVFLNDDRELDACERDHKDWAVQYKRDHRTHLFINGTTVFGGQISGNQIDEQP